MLAAAAVVIAGCGDNASDAKAPAAKKVSATANKTEPVKKKPKTDTEQLEHLLFERGWALEKGDTAGFLATSTGEQARKDNVQMARAKALPINDVKLTAGGTEINGDKATMRVEMRYGFDNIDTVYFKTSRMSAEKTPQGWRISNDRPSAGMLAPWEYTAYKARKSA